MKNKIWLMGGVLAITFMATQTRAEDAQIKNPLDPEVVVNNKKFLEVVGIGAVDAQNPNLTQRRALAREAATAQAQTKILAVINSLRVEPENPNTEPLQIQRLQRAMIMKTQWNKDDSCRVTLKLDKKEFQKLTGIKLKDR